MMSAPTKSKHVALLVAAVLASVVGTTAYGETRTWKGTTINGVAWLNTDNWIDGLVAGSTDTSSNDDVARFSNNTTLTAAIDMAITEGVYYLGALQRVTGSTNNRIIRNGNGGAADAGVLTLNGATLDTTAGGVGTTNVILHQATTAGTFSINNGTGTGNYLDINLPAAVNYKVVIDSGSTVTVNSNVTGPGGLTTLRAAGSSALFQLLGNNSYAGDTIVDSARLRAGGGNGIPNGPGKGNLILQGTPILGPPAQPLFGIIADETVNGLFGDGFVDNDGNTPFTLSIGDNDATSTFDGTIYNTGGAANTGYLNVTKVGGGTLTLNGDNTYSGVTLVEEGTMLMNGTHFGFHSNPAKLSFTDNYTIFSGATLGGDGVSGAAVNVEAGGFLAPGTSIGTLTVGSAAIHGTLRIEGAGSQIDKLIVGQAGDPSGDFNEDGVVDSADYVVWRRNSGVDSYDDWRANFGATESFVGGILNIESATLDLTGLGSMAAGTHVFAEYGSLFGNEFNNVIGLPSVFSIDYDFEGNKIALVSIGAVENAGVPEPSLLGMLAGVFLIGLNNRKVHR